MLIFESQRNARSESRKLLLAFALTVLLLVVLVNAALALAWGLTWGFWVPGEMSLPRHFIAVNTAVVLVFVLGGWWVETSHLASGGGQRLAEQLGARLAQPSGGLDEQRFANIVDEMAVSSGLKRPQAMVLPRDSGINAFAAGWAADDAVVAVTQGALDHLTREELQGLVAHEFSHIVEGDTRLNMRLIGMVFGLEMLYRMGQQLAQPDERDRRMAAALLGLGLMAAGWLGWLAGHALQAAVSRQREYLADARAVQWTRSRDGLGGVLRKVLSQRRAGLVSRRIGSHVQHMLLISDHEDPVADWLDSHPTLEQRIRRIYGRAMGPLPLEKEAPAATPAPANPPDANGPGWTLVWASRVLSDTRRFATPNPARFDAPCPPPPLPRGRLAPSLAIQLHHTARCVQGVEQGHSLSELLPQLPGGLRPGVQALTFLVLRRLGTARALVAQLARKPAPAVQAMLCCAVALLIDEPGTESETRAAPYRPHTVVNQAVEAVRQQRDTQRAAAFVNACLRRLLRERDALMLALTDNMEARWNHPRWWVERLQRDHPEHWQAILRANNRPGPMTLRVNRRQTGVVSYQQALQAQGMQARPVGEDGLVLDSPQPVERLPGFADGLCSVQDAAAQRAAPLLLEGPPLAPGARVLDACAAPGGKTAHLLERADLDLLALDVDPQRCARITDTMARLRLRADVRAADAAQPADWWDGRAFDAILLDAPCTASGIVRRHPDVRWLRRDSDVAQLAGLQKRLLEALWPLLKPGGRLVYATCSVFRAEGAGQVASFLERHTDAVLWPSPGHLMPGNADDPTGLHDNEPGGQDGFFYARIDKAMG